MLINCAAYRDGLRIADLTVEQIQPMLAEPGVFVWIALRDPDAEELRAVQRQFGLHELAVEDAQKGHQRPKVEEYGDVLFTVLHLVDLEGSELHHGEMAIFTGANFIVSLRHGSQQKFMGVRERCEREPELLRLGPGFVLYALMDAIVDRYFPIVEWLEGEIESIEESIFEQGAARGNIQRLYALKRRLMTMKHAVAPLLDYSYKLYGGRVPAPCARVQEYFRDVNDHLARISVSIESIREMIATAMTVNISMVTIEDSEVTKRLAAWAGIFAVATAFAGIWGMNFEHMPELKWAWGYPAALLIIGATCGVVWWRFRRLRWV